MLQFNADLSARLQHQLEKFNYGAQPKKMFGHEVFFVNGYMFTGANVLGIFVHVGKEQVDFALETEKGVVPLSPMEGMVMKDYLLLGESIHKDEKKLKTWLDRAQRIFLYLVCESELR